MCRARVVAVAVAIALASSMALAVLCARPPSAHAQAVETVTLAGLIEAGRRHHPTLARRPLLARSFDVESSKLNRAYWPQLSLDGSATWQSTVTSVDVPVPGVTIPKPSQDQYKLALELQQTIWDGGATADRKRVAEERARLDKHQVGVEWREVRERILQLYFTGLVQQKLRSQAQVLDEYLTTVIEKAQLALDQGVATERDVLLARARQLEARQAAAEASAHLDGVKRALAHLTGQDLQDDAVLAPALASCVVNDARAVTPDAVKRPELDALAAQSQLLGAQEALELSPDRPRVGAFATAGYGRPGLNALSSEFDFFFIGGLRVTVPLTYLYAGTHGKSHEQLAIQRALVDRKRDALMTRINVELETQRADLERLDATIELDSELLGVREKARKQTETQLALGTATMTDLINDLTLEDQARTRLAVHHTQRDHVCHEVALTTGNP
ncbi:MAG: TolC family protein [Myxococcales bacterium]|jgi:outer membrane protein TolC